MVRNECLCSQRLSLTDTLCVYRYCPGCKTDTNEVIGAGEKMKLGKKKANMMSKKQECNRDWGKVVHNTLNLIKCYMKFFLECREWLVLDELKCVLLYHPIILDQFLECQWAACGSSEFK